MISKIYLVLSCLIILAKGVPAQTLQPEDPSYLPSISVNVKKTPSYTPKSDLINIMEQNGLYPYKGQECQDLSMSFTEADDGKKYASNEFAGINLRITQYGSQGKMIFNQLKPYDETIRQLQEFAASSKMEADNVGTRKSRNVISKDASHGKMVLVKDIITCMESKYSQYTVISFRSVALVGTTILNIMGSYNSDDELLANKIHAETP